MNSLNRDMKEEILENIIKLLEAGYEVRMTDNSFTVVEIYKSKSRDKYHEIKVKDSFGSFSYWSKGALHIIANSIREAVKELTNIDKPL